MFISSLSVCVLHIFIKGGKTEAYYIPLLPASSTFLESLTLEVDVGIEVVFACVLFNTQSRYNEDDNKSKVKDKHMESSDE